MSFSRSVAILGATGQLGSDLVRAAAAAGVPHAALSHEEVEVTDAESLAQAFGRLTPAVVVNSAAFHQVDRCEGEPGEAYRVNAVGALLAARAAKAAGARYLYVSTDYVFDGARDPSTSYVEDDRVAPLNVYGASKAAGEQLVAQALENHLVIRVSSLFGVAGARGKGGNFIEAILKKAREGTPLRVVDDQRMTPTYAKDAAQAIMHLALGDTTGIVHVTNNGACTWYAFASAAVRLAGLAVPVQAVQAKEFQSVARRPRNSALATERLVHLLRAPLPRWELALAAYLREKGHIA